MRKKNATQNLWYKGVEQGSCANRNAFPGQKLCQHIFVRAAHWMAYFHLSKPKYSLKLLRPFE